jgi:hypothetical protein
MADKGSIHVETINSENHMILDCSNVDISGELNVQRDVSINGRLDVQGDVNVGNLLKFDTGSLWGDLINIRGGLSSEYGYQTMVSHNYHQETFRPQLEFKFGYVDHPDSGTTVSRSCYITYDGLHVDNIKPQGAHLKMSAYADTIGEIRMGYGGNRPRKIILSVQNAHDSNDAQIYFVKDGSWKSWSEISSDSRIKQNQQLYPPSDSMNIVRFIKVKKYFNTELKAEVKGFIAQEVEEILPEAVKTHDLSEEGKESDFKMLDYRRLQVHAFGAIQFLDSLVQAQQNEINDLKAENSLIKSKLNEILSEMGKETI